MRWGRGTVSPTTRWRGATRGAEGTPRGAVGRGWSVAARAAQRATQTIPIVMESGDPIGTEVVAGRARPGGNITGLTNFSLDLVGERLELLKELVPGLTRVAVLWDLEGPSKVLECKEAERIALVLGMQLHSWGVHAPRPDLRGRSRPQPRSLSGQCSFWVIR